ncbi:unnamed protein product [Musa textilis]
MTIPGAVIQGDMHNEQIIITLLLHNGREIDGEVIGKDEAIEDIIDANENPTMLLRYDDMHFVLTSLALCLVSSTTCNYADIRSESENSGIRIINSILRFCSQHHTYCRENLVTPRTSFSWVPNRNGISSSHVVPGIN